MSVGESSDFQTMEHSLEDLQKLGGIQIVKESINIPRSSPKTFFLLMLTLVFPLSLGILAHNVIASYLFNYVTDASGAAADSPDQNLSTTPSRMCLFFAYQFINVIFLFTFSLLSTGAMVFTFASLYISKPTSSLRAIPLAFRRLFVTFFYISLLIFFFHLLFFATLIFLILLLVMHPHTYVLVFVVSVLTAFLLAYVYISALWHLASVITVLEPVQGLDAMVKSHQLLQGKAWLASVLVFVHLALCTATGFAFCSVMSEGWPEDKLWARILIGLVLVVVLMAVNLVGLLVQSVFYYLCKSHHNQTVDRTALYERLGGYVGDYVPLKSMIQMESLNEKRIVGRDEPMHACC